MATKDQVIKVWIEPGCIVCDACETASPTVFEVLEDSCIVRPDALDVEFTRPLTDSIVEAAEECPVDVIKYDTEAVEVPDETPVPAPAAEAPAPAAVAESAPAAAPPPAAAPQPAAATVKASPAPAIDSNIRKQLETMTARGGVAGRAKLSPAQQYKDSPTSNLPPDARFMRMIEAGRDASAKRKPEVSRIDFVKLTAWGSFVGASTLSSYGFFVRFMFPNVLNEPEKRIRVGPMDKFRELPPGAVNLEYKNFGFWIVRVEDRIAALSTTCTHLGCIPSWLEADRKFKCPCHGSGFKQTGINFEGPAPRPLERFNVIDEDGILIVDKARKFQYEKGEWENPDSFITV